jgi:hypothetical protein
MRETSELLFLKGNYEKIARFERDLDVFRIAALVFLGRGLEAEILFDKWKSKLATDELATAAFFLSVGWTRASEFSKSKRYLSLLFKMRWQLKASSSRVLVFQAFGFYRYFTSRFRGSFQWASRAWRIAIRDEYLLGQILSCDLLAHSMLQVGEIERGFFQLNQAKRLAERFGRTAIVASLEVSELTYRAQYGIDPSKNLDRLSRTYLKSKTSRDTFTKANLGLELSHQFVLRGEVKKAKLILNDLRKDVFKHGHRRQRATWHLRASECDYLAGEIEKSSGQLREAKQVLDQKHDLSILLQVLVHEESVTGKLNSQIEEIGHKVGSLISVRQLVRRKRQMLRPNPQDPFGNLLDAMASSDNLIGQSRFELFQELADLKYFGLLSQFVFRELGSTPRDSIIVDVLPASVLVSLKGTSFFCRTGLTAMLRRCLVLLADRPRTKEELVEELWGYAYESHRHDPLIHGVLSRLRKLLGPVGSWVKSEGEHYRLSPSAAFHMYRHVSKAAGVVRLEEDRGTRAVLESRAILGPGLNYRQLRILNELKRRSELSVRDCMELLNATKITANRDLKALLDSDLISSSGRGKSTRYHATQSQLFAAESS